MTSDVILDRSWTDGGGDSVCLLVEKRSAQLEVEELGSGSVRDIEGWGWLGGRLQGDRGSKGGESRMEEKEVC